MFVASNSFVPAPSLRVWTSSKLLSPEGVSVEMLVATTLESWAKMIEEAAVAVPPELALSPRSKVPVPRLA